MVFNCKPISQEMPDSTQGKQDSPLNLLKNDNPDEVITFSLIVRGCSYLRRVELFLKGINGVESVKGDGNSAKLEVMGKVDPFKIQEMVKHETKKEVELFLPSSEMEGDRGEKKGTKGKFIRRVMPMPENDVANEKTGENIFNLKIKLCCESCNKHLQKALKTKGLEMVTIEEEKDLVTVRGTVGMTELRSYIKNKLKKDIEVLNLAEVMASTKIDNAAVNDKGRDAGAIDKKYEGKNGGNKEAEDGGAMMKSTVVLKLRLHCDGCIQKIRKVIMKCRGVKSVSVNADKDLVTVKGTMDVQELTSYLEEKIKSNVKVVLVKKKDKKDKDDDSENKDN
ncbi:Heavy metal-associated isoprenylated plant protein [Melia azedarach]|uniref:Heavy metal-associated isoprenylated plant protein n=1 Tax=Melia azedarach TaxID=155640 RepID=A0ACC1X0P6_MELAZ|nr:Heavy metal-associated isoprenylated plant protein [Melia azedarach]